MHTTTTNWDDPNQCPFCEEGLADGGAGFVDHIDDRPGCQDSFEQWRGRVREDMTSGWSG